MKKFLQIYNEISYDPTRKKKDWMKSPERGLFLTQLKETVSKNLFGYDQMEDESTEDFQKRIIDQNKKNFKIIADNNKQFLLKLLLIIRNYSKSNGYPDISKLNRIGFLNKKVHSYSFIIPFENLMKMQTDEFKVYEDAGFLNYLGNNSFSIIEPEDENVNENNIKISWGDIKMSLVGFFEMLTFILADYRDYDTLYEFIERESSLKDFLAYEESVGEGKEKRIKDKIINYKNVNQLESILKKLIVDSSRSEISGIDNSIISTYKNLSDSYNKTNKRLDELNKRSLSFFAGKTNEERMINKKKQTDELESLLEKNSEKFDDFKKDITLIFNNKNNPKKIKEILSKHFSPKVSGLITLDTIERLFSDNGELKENIKPIKSGESRAISFSNLVDEEIKFLLGLSEDDLINKSINSDFQKMTPMIDTIKRIKDKKYEVHHSKKEILSFLNHNFGSEGRKSGFLDFINKYKELETEYQKSAIIFNQNIDKLKELIEEIKNKGSVPYNESYRFLGTLRSDIETLTNRLVKPISMINRMTRFFGFLKIFQDRKYADSFNSDISKIDISDYFVMVTIDPSSVATQSTFTDAWWSCQELTGGRETGNNEKVGSGFLVGNIVAYLLTPDYSKYHPQKIDPSKQTRINLDTYNKIKDLESEEEHPWTQKINEFKKFVSKGVMGTYKKDIVKFLSTFTLVPVGRVLIKTFQLDDNQYDINYPRPEAVFAGDPIDTLKVTDNLYSADSSRESSKAIINKKGLSRKDEFGTVPIQFYNKMNNLVRMLSGFSKPGNYYLNPMQYDDGLRGQVLTKAKQKLYTKQKLIFSTLTTEELEDLVEDDPNLYKYKTFRFAYFSKEDKNIIDISNTKIISLDPFHPTNYPLGPGIPGYDSKEEIIDDSWKVDDNFRKNVKPFNVKIKDSEYNIKF